MKKVTLPLALMALSLGQSAHAQTPSNVTVYGIADMGFVHESGNAAGSTNKLTSGMMGGSRFGFRGSEDLGGGLAAIFTLESGFAMDSGTSTQSGRLFGRQAFVGLASPYGTLTMGRQYTSVAMVQTDMDPFTTGLAGHSANMISAGGAGGDNRADNMIKYSVPSLGLPGVSGEVSYALGEVAGGGLSSGSQVGASVSYTAGPLKASVGYADAHDANGPGKDARELFMGTRYSFGFATAYVDLVLNRGAIVPGTPNYHSYDILVGATAPIGRGKAIISYIRKNDQTAANFDAQMLAIGYIYSLSKRTSLYTSFGHIWNKAPNTSATGFYRVWNANDIGNQAAGNNAVSVGINHAF